MKAKTLLNKSREMQNLKTEVNNKTKRNSFK